MKQFFLTSSAVVVYSMKSAMNRVYSLITVLFVFFDVDNIEGDVSELMYVP